MRQGCPILFDYDEPAAGEAYALYRGAATIPSAEGKAQSKCTAAGMPVHSFQTLLQDLRTVG